MATGGSRWPHSSAHTPPTSLAAALGPLAKTLQQPRGSAAGATSRRLRSFGRAEQGDKLTLIVSDGRGRKTRMQVPMVGMSKLYDFFEEK